MMSLDFISWIGGCVHQVTQSYGLILSLFLAGLVGSVTHCVVMCGPFVLSQTGNMTKIRDTALIPYHLGRMTTYLFLALLTYSFFSVLFVYSDLKALIAVPMLMTAGLIFLISAFPQISVLFPWISQMKLSIPSHFFQKMTTSTLFDKHNMLSRYFLGVLLGFMPCSLVIAAIIACATADNLAEAMMAMIAFTSGTIPALMLVGMTGGSLQKKHPKFSLRFSQIAKTISALWLFILAGTLIL